MMRGFLLLGLWVVGCARPVDPWKANRQQLQGHCDEFSYAFRSPTKCTILTTDLEGRPLQPAQVDRGTSVNMAYKCGQVLRVVRAMGTGSVIDQPKAYFGKAFVSVKLVTCQFAHDPSDTTQPPAEVSPVEFVPANGDTVEEIHIVVDRQLYGDYNVAESRVVAAMNRRFPSLIHLPPP